MGRLRAAQARAARAARALDLTTSSAAEVAPLEQLQAQLKVRLLPASARDTAWAQRTRDTA